LSKSIIYIFIGFTWITGVFLFLFYLYKKSILPELTDPIKINERKNLRHNELKQYNSLKPSILTEEDILVINKFNWGAFLCSILWGIINGSWKTILIGLLTLIPILGIVPAIYIGINANKWAFPKYRRTPKEYIFEQNLILIFCLIISIIVNSYTWSLVQQGGNL